MSRIRVELDDRSYTIYIGNELFSPGKESTQLSVFAEGLQEIKRGDRACVVTNTTVEPLYLESTVNALENSGLDVDSIVLPDGERYKSLDVLDTVFEHLLTKQHDRKTLLVALGGGVVGDTAGFAAACYQRGVDFIQIPTTLLSQVDSSVGGKTGINHALGKNMVGAFYQPKAVFIDSATLLTLPAKELSAGLAEVIKYGLIYDHDFLWWLEENMGKLRNGDFEELEKAIFRSCEIKAQVVAEDERENGRRAILNLGHTFGHAIEAHMGYGAWLHGEAVGAGMIMAAYMSHLLSMRGDERFSPELDTDWLQRVIHIIDSAGLPLCPPSEMTEDDFLKFMKVDKKNEAGKIKLVLLSGKGESIITSDYPSEVLSKVLKTDYTTLLDSVAAGRAVG